MIRLTLFKLVVIVVLFGSVAKAEAYLPIVHSTLLGQTVPLALEPTGEPLPPEGTEHQRQPGYAVVQAKITRYDSDAIKIVLLEPGHIENVVHLDLLVKREREVLRREIWLKLGETQEIYMNGGSLAVWSMGDGGVVVYQWRERADWTIIGTAIWL